MGKNRPWLRVPSPSTPEVITDGERDTVFDWIRLKLVCPMSSRRSKTPKSRRKKDNSNTFSSRPAISLDGFDYYIRFTSKASPTIRTLTRRRFEESGLFVRQLIGGNEENRDAFFLLRMENTMQLEAAAEHVGIVKLRLNGDREEFEVSDRSEFENVGKKDFFTKSEISR